MRIQDLLNDTEPASPPPTGPAPNAASVQPSPSHPAASLENSSSGLGFSAFRHPGTPHDNDVYEPTEEDIDPIIIQIYAQLSPPYIPTNSLLGTRCKICKQRGHTRSTCPCPSPQPPPSASNDVEPGKQPRCTLCGKRGHYRTTCGRRRPDTDPPRSPIRWV
ncbi:hypothetical protein FB45DRAFT_932276 [Roridomyces roridus]|uniref:CCHC-type domain-containing protein n=1 Tax=Roridomyces roridus TaxID=1738132 RepID=A0AAD7BEP1_9AGAR|nr:hypothetical protein FB45DRAFT_932276 [Roridomyces roridus]